MSAVPPPPSPTDFAGLMVRLLEEMREQRKALTDEHDRAAKERHPSPVRAGIGTAKLYEAARKQIASNLGHARPQIARRTSVGATRGGLGNGTD
jgi:hypothetical protein